MQHLAAVPCPRSVRLHAVIESARRAQADWAAVPVASRVEVASGLRRLLAERAESIAGALQLPHRASDAETLSAEVLPLADACRFLEREAERLLVTRTLGRRGRPAWLAGSSVELARDPWGVVAVLAPSNYPLFLPGVHTLQALVAGNAVVLKPGRGGAEAATLLAGLLDESGLPRDLFVVVDESVASGSGLLGAGVDKVVLTGSIDTGRAVMRSLATTMTPAVMELSGCDAVFVREDADIELTVRALSFGLTWNGGFTCIAPRRVFVARSVAEVLESNLAAELASRPSIAVAPHAVSSVDRVVANALQHGARIVSGQLPVDGSMRPLVVADATVDMEIMRDDVPAPVLAIVEVADDDEAVTLADACDYALGVSIFGSDRGSRRLAERVRAGVVVINDMIVPTADPRIPFAGRGKSGFGVTRGAEGLLDMTRVRSVVRRSGRFRPHFDPIGPSQRQMVLSFLRLAHAPAISQRLRALGDLVTSAVRIRREGSQ